mgnify:CR=1 FL=1
MEKYSDEFQFPTTKIITASYQLGKDPDGVMCAAFWVNYHCYRKSMKKFEFCDVTQKFSFNDDNRITEIQEMNPENLRFTN